VVGVGDFEQGLGSVAPEASYRAWPSRIGMMWSCSAWMIRLARGRFESCRLAETGNFLNPMAARLTPRSCNRGPHRQSPLSTMSARPLPGRRPAQLQGGALPRDRPMTIRGLGSPSPAATPGRRRKLRAVPHHGGHGGGPAGAAVTPVINRKKLEALAIIEGANSVIIRPRSRRCRERKGWWGRWRPRMEADPHRRLPATGIKRSRAGGWTSPGFNSGRGWNNRSSTSGTSRGE